MHKYKDTIIREYFDEVDQSMGWVELYKAHQDLTVNCEVTIPELTVADLLTYVVKELNLKLHSIIIDEVEEIVILTRPVSDEEIINDCK